MKSVLVLLIMSCVAYAQEQQITYGTVINFRKQIDFDPDGKVDRYAMFSKGRQLHWPNDKDNFSDSGCTLNVKSQSPKFTLTAQSLTTVGRDKLPPNSVGSYGDADPIFMLLKGGRLLTMECTDYTASFIKQTFGDYLDFDHINLLPTPPAVDQAEKSQDNSAT